MALIDPRTLPKYVFIRQSLPGEFVALGEILAYNDNVSPFLGASTFQEAIDVLKVTVNTAFVWSDAGPGLALSPLEGPTKPVIIGDTAVIGTEILRVAGASRLEGQITLTDLVQWSDTTLATALGELGVDKVSGRPSFFC
jgi:hypothetical protein